MCGIRKSCGGHSTDLVVQAFVAAIGQFRGDCGVDPLGVAADLGDGFDRLRRVNELPAQFILEFLGEPALC